MAGTPDEAQEMVASLGQCPACGVPVLVWEVVGMGMEGVHTDTVIICDNCETHPGRRRVC